MPLVYGKQASREFLESLETKTGALRTELQTAIEKASFFSDESVASKMEEFKKRYAASDKSNYTAADTSKKNIQKEALGSLLHHLTGKHWYAAKWKFFYSVLDLREKILTSPEFLVVEALNQDISEIIAILKGFDYHIGRGKLETIKGTMPLFHQMSCNLLVEGPTIAASPVEMRFHLKYLKDNMDSFVDSFCTDYLKNKGVLTQNFDQTWVDDVKSRVQEMCAYFMKRLQKISLSNKSILSIREEYEVIQKYIKSMLKANIPMYFSSKDRGFVGHSSRKLNAMKLKPSECSIFSLGGFSLERGYENNLGL